VLPVEKLFHDLLMKCPTMDPPPVFVEKVSPAVRTMLSFLRAEGVYIDSNPFQVKDFSGFCKTISMLLVDDSDVFVDSRLLTVHNVKKMGISSVPKYILRLFKAQVLDRQLHAFSYEMRKKIHWMMQLNNFIESNGDRYVMTPFSELGDMLTSKNEDKKKKKEAKKRKAEEEAKKAEEEAKKAEEEAKKVEEEAKKAEEEAKKVAEEAKKVAVEAEAKKAEEAKNAEPKKRRREAEDKDKVSKKIKTGELKKEKMFIDNRPRFGRSADLAVQQAIHSINDAGGINLPARLDEQHIRHGENDANATSCCSTSNVPPLIFHEYSGVYYPESMDVTDLPATLAEVSATVKTSYITIAKRISILPKIVCAWIPSASSVVAFNNNNTIFINLVHEFPFRSSFDREMTLAHEVAHSGIDCMNHGLKWSHLFACFAHKMGAPEKPCIIDLTD
jgi:hypothetical protein